MFKVLYLYILECSDGSYYIGVTNNLDKRIIQHNTGVNPIAYTFSRRPVKLVFSQIFQDYSQAFEWETKLKKWNKSKKKALIEGRLDLLPTLSKKNFAKKKSAISSSLKRA